MTDLTAFSNYEEYKKTLTEELTKASESFVRIGYLLKVARDTAILAGTAYSDVNEFAAAEYNLDKTQVSRFIRINDRFSEGGNSDRLQESFRGIGYAKLSMMLLLPDSLNEEITPAFSKTEVQALKEEVQAEAAVTPLERLMEPVRPAMENMNLVEKAVYELFRGNQKIYADVFGMTAVAPDTDAGKKMLQEILAPAGEAIHSVRIAGIGRIAISVKGLDREVMLVNLRSNEKTPCNWDEVLDAVSKFISPLYVSSKAAYEDIFGEPWQEESEKPKVAPVQPQKKESKVTKAAPDKKPKPVKPKIEPVKPEPEPEEPKEADSGSEEPAPELVTEGIEKAADATEALAETVERFGRAASEAGTSAEAFTQTLRNVTGNSVEIPEDPEGCEGQADFNDIPEILPAPVYELDEEDHRWIRMWIHNLRADLAALADSKQMPAETLIKASLPVIRAELDKLEA